MSSFFLTFLGPRTFCWVINRAFSSELANFSNKVDRSQWLKALEYAKHRAMRQILTLEDDEDESQRFLIKTKGLKELATSELNAMSGSIRALSIRFSEEILQTKDQNCLRQRIGRVYSLCDWTFLC